MQGRGDISPGLVCVAVPTRHAPSIHVLTALSQHLVCCPPAQDLWEVLVDEVDVEARAKQQELEKAQQAASHEERVLQQSRAAETLAAEIARTMRAAVK